MTVKLPITVDNILSQQFDQVQNNYNGYRIRLLSRI